MQKKEPATSNKVSLETKCGECMHFKTGPAQFEKICSDLGVKAYALPCNSFFPDVLALNKLDSSTILKIKEVMQGCTASQAKIVAFVLSRKAWLEKSKFNFGDVVYFCLGQNYLCNYIKGYVIGSTKNGEELFAVSDIEGIQKTNAKIRLMRSSALNEVEFEKVRKALIKKDQILEPSTRLKPSTFDTLRMSKKQYQEFLGTLQRKPDDYIPPTIDSVPTKWIDKRVSLKLVDPAVAKRTARGNIKINRQN